MPDLHSRRDGVYHPSMAVTTYTITNEDGSESEQFDSMATLFDGLIMRGNTAIEALNVIGGLVTADLERQCPPSQAN